MVPKIVCVLKSGGDYSPEYVEKLRCGVEKHYRASYEFLCLTDFPPEQFHCQTIRLEKNLPGWWSKLEIFQFTAPTLYFDLDTVITDDIEPLSHLFREGDFYMISPWGRASLADNIGGSGVMLWEGDFSFLLREFNYDLMNKYRLGGDQRYISKRFAELGIKQKYIQDKFDGLVSYKLEILTGSYRGHPHIVCFHGHPRPHEVGAPWWS